MFKFNSHLYQTVHLRSWTRMGGIPVVVMVPVMAEETAAAAAAAAARVNTRTPPSSIPAVAVAGEGAQSAGS